jgi:glycosyltransferase involved in cell wall biosynthesis
MPDQKRLTVSVIIKAFNEEQHIAAAIESALAALAGLEGEVILADGASTDRTIAIAEHYPIKIVRLNNPEDRSCGAGAQLGFQYSSGQFLCLMDGDMRLDAGFIATGIRFLDENPKVGGVGGAIVDRDVSNLEYQQRARRFDRDRRPGLVTRLNGSGLYRRSAIESAGYLTDRNLHGCEEFDLAARLIARGWTLARIDHHAIDHYGYVGNAYRQLVERMWTRNACGPGELFRAALLRPHFGFLLRNDRTALLSALVVAWWLSIAAAATLANGVLAVIVIAALAAFPFVVMSRRWRSQRSGIYSVVSWNVFTLCFLPGLLRPRVPPTAWIASTVLQDPVIARASLDVAYSPAP